MPVCLAQGARVIRNSKQRTMSNVDYFDYVDSVQVEFLVEQCKKLHHLAVHREEQRRLVQEQLDEHMEGTDTKDFPEVSGQSMVEDSTTKHDCIRATILRQELKIQETVIEQLRKDLIDAKATIVKLEVRLVDAATEEEEEEAEDWAAGTAVIQLMKAWKSLVAFLVIHFSRNLEGLDSILKAAASS
ncbi:hypothetical protein Pmar_PMAR022063 [Perkinsus marinus ATCC 50983]|uniref:Uncharacterized protein n=1 Tax=Perkinsus marinus (strain ATCC 50983 / TXsc) TaxID=423536 RepID=C5KKT9_PERM5|nr:hypothetical protein Pmar_PMAR022063 [Perkinsus marinus ATCC 50983]EER14900.1 hypothetical protein Pmar_PMAR022063 [Perkinsus marinus ATCC 50983]|eukprot:XP_002783104.1 hypothetical protein Pmar_PMAR022063 [Perkinsus marinus ATCC 50983]